MIDYKNINMGVFMNYLSKANRLLLEATLCNLFYRTERGMDVSEIQAGLLCMTDAELEQALNDFIAVI